MEFTPATPFIQCEKILELIEFKTVQIWTFDFLVFMQQKGSPALVVKLLMGSCVSPGKVLLGEM
jgi:hypothetical protein